MCACVPCERVRSTAKAAAAFMLCVAFDDLMCSMHFMYVICQCVVRKTRIMYTGLNNVRPEDVTSRRITYDYYKSECRHPIAAGIAWRARNGLRRAPFVIRHAIWAKKGDGNLPH